MDWYLRLGEIVVTVLEVNFQINHVVVSVTDRQTDKQTPMQVILNANFIAYLWQFNWTLFLYFGNQ